MEEAVEVSSRHSMTVVLASLILPLFAIWYAYYRYRNKRFFHLAEQLPGPKGYPLIGNIIDLIGGPHSIFKIVLGHTYKFNNVMKMWAGPRLFVFLTDPDDVELILSSQDHLDKSDEYRFFEPWLGNGLLISSGEKWRTHRKLIAPTFHLNVLKSFFELFNINSRVVVERLKTIGDKEFDCHDYLSEATVEILLETVMGVNRKKQENAFDYAIAVMKMCDILQMRQTKLWLRPDFLFQLSSYGWSQKKLLRTIHNLTRKVLKIRKAAYESEKEKSHKLFASVINENKMQEKEVRENKQDQLESNYSFGQSTGLKDDLDVEDNNIGEKKRMAFLDLLIHNAQQGVLLTEEEIQNQVDTIMFEGHDTTAAGSSFFLCLMAAHPHIQEKVLEELDQIFGNSDRDVTFHDTLEMKYLERSIMETLRLYPPVPVIARKLKKEMKLKSSSLIIPENCTVIIGTYKMHRLENIYPNALAFNPDNFLPENSASRHYYSYVPFSAGPRSCVGRKYAMLKLKVLLSTILRNYKVVSNIPEQDWLLQADIILKRTDGFRIKLEPRKHVAAK